VTHLTFAPSAINDAHDILARLTEKAGQSVAVAYFERFRLTFDRLTAFPLSGAPRPNLGVAVRIAVIRPYVVIYRTTADTVEILRVVHGRRRIKRRLLTKG